MLQNHAGVASWVFERNQSLPDHYLPGAKFHMQTMQNETCNKHMLNSHGHVMQHSSHMIRVKLITLNFESHGIFSFTPTIFTPFAPSGLRMFTNQTSITGCGM
jgi:hypothetical protein